MLSLLDNVPATVSSPGIIGRPEQNPIDDVAALADYAAQLQGRTIARVTTAGELNDSQRAGESTRIAGPAWRHAVVEGHPAEVRPMRGRPSPPVREERARGNLLALPKQSRPPSKYLASILPGT